MTPLDTAPAIRSRPLLVDGFGRTVTYLRVSVTDRCDLRCVYCMSEHMTFLPKAQVLTLEELKSWSGFKGEAQPVPGGSGAQLPSTRP